MVAVDSVGFEPTISLIANQVCVRRTASPVRPAGLAPAKGLTQRLLRPLQLLLWDGRVMYMRSVLLKLSEKARLFLQAQEPLEQPNAVLRNHQREEDEDRRDDPVRERNRKRRARAEPEEERRDELVLGREQKRGNVAARLYARVL